MFLGTPEEELLIFSEAPSYKSLWQPCLIFTDRITLILQKIL